MARIMQALCSKRIRIQVAYFSSFFLTLYEVFILSIFGLQMFSMPETALCFTVVLLSIYFSLNIVISNELRATYNTKNIWWALAKIVVILVILRFYFTLPATLFYILPVAGTFVSKKTS